eukprot:145257-Pyramimonas_sp.AAC.1
MATFLSAQPHLRQASFAGGSSSETMARASRAAWFILNTSDESPLACSRWREARPMYLEPSAPGAPAEFAILRAQLCPGVEQHLAPLSRTQILFTVGKTYGGFVFWE